MTLKDENRKKTMKRVIRGLVAGTCLTAAAAAHAGTITESTDFSNSLAGAVSSPLAVGTTQVNGFANGQDIDFVDFAGLLAGGSFTLVFHATGVLTEQQFGVVTGDLDFSAFDSAGLQFGTTQVGATIATFTGTIPNDGQLVAQVTHNEGNNYRIDLTAPLASTTTPEPATAALAGTALGIAGLLRARRRKQ